MSRSSRWWFATILLVGSLVLGAEGSQAPVLTGPFGLEAGAGREQVEEVLGELSPVRPAVFMTSSVPGDWPHLETLSLVITPNQGLCRLQATTALFPSAADGAEVRRRFAELQQRLTQSHGEPSLLDTADGKSAGESWMADLRQKRAALVAVWNAAGGSELGFNLASVTLSARALKDDEAFLTVDYLYTIWDYCRPALEAAEAAAEAAAKNAEGAP
ncbi:MAG: hypothetical protein SX243_08385 [Acidobacteriota bacterium]|nr:hypothetical protein [Acidobacteriota bacterium]